MKERRGICSACGEERSVTAAGKIRQHFTLSEHGPWRTGTECEGVGLPPSAMSDPIGEAEARGFQRAIDALRAESAESLKRIVDAGGDSPMWDHYDSAADYLVVLREEEASS